jgi:hypothetical protein
MKKLLMLISIFACQLLFYNNTMADTPAFIENQGACYRDKGINCNYNSFKDVYGDLYNSSKTNTIGPIVYRKPKSSAILTPEVLESYKDITLPAPY